MAKLVQFYEHRDWEISQRRQFLLGFAATRRRDTKQTVLMVDCRSQFRTHDPVYRKVASKIRGHSSEIAV